MDFYRKFCLVRVSLGQSIFDRIEIITSTEFNEPRGLLKEDRRHAFFTRQIYERIADPLVERANCISFAHIDVLVLLDSLIILDVRK